MWRLTAQIPEDAWADATDLPGAQVAQTFYTPDGWRHEPLRLIVRRTLYTAAQISASANARRRKTIHPDLERLRHLGNLAPLAEHPILLAQLAHDLLRGMPSTLHIGPPLADCRGR